MLCALLKNNIVVAIEDVTEEQLADSVFIHQYSNIIDVSDSNPTPAIGWVFNGSTILPPNFATPTPSMIITKLAYRQRFTTTEMVGLYTAMTNNPVLRMLIDNLSVASFIDLKRTDTISGTMYLVQQGLLTYERSQIILNTVPTLTEIYKG